MDKITHEVRLAQWKKVIEECHARPKGQTAKSWLSERGISEKCFYYWQRKLRLYAYEEMQQPASLPADKGSAPVTFAEIPFATQPQSEQILQGQFRPAAVIRSGNIAIALSNSVSEALLAGIMEEVRRA